MEPNKKRNVQMQILSFLVALFTAFTMQAQPRHIEFNSKNLVAIQGEIDDETISEAQIKLLQLVTLRGSATYPIYIGLDSPGGSISSGLDFIEFAKVYRNVETVTLFAASMAAGIVEALPGKRYILDSGTLMFHRARGGVEGQFESGELESRLSYYKDLVRSMELANANRMQMSLDTYKSQVKDELWIFGQNAVSKKAADEVVTISCTTELAGKSNAKTINFFGLTFNVELNACPLIKTIKVSRPENKALLKQYLERIKWRQ